MSFTTKIKSIGIILDYLEVHKSATAEQLMNRLKEHEMASSERTFERLKSDMFIDFGLELVYENQAYILRKNSNPSQAWFLNMVDIIREMEFYKNAIEHPLYQNRILYEESNKPNFYYHLAPLFQAIVKSRKISFTYHFFDMDQWIDISMEPYLLKKFQQRWYVIGRSDYHGEIRSYGLDRISNLHTLKDTFNFKNYIELIAKFNSIVGLNYSNQPIRMVLRVFDLQQYYLQELPLHHSQKEVSRGENWTDFEYHLRPNFELMQQLMRIADQAVVLEPLELRNQFLEKMRNAMKLYELN